MKKYYKIIRATKYHDNLIVDHVLQIKDCITKKVVKSFKFWCTQGNLNIGNYDLAFEQAQKFLRNN